MNDNRYDNFSTACTCAVATRFEEIGVELSLADKVKLFMLFDGMIKKGWPTAIFEKLGDLYTGKEP